MDLLILGGTRFLGKHLVDAALSRGHNVTLFNRGQSNPNLFPQVEKLQGDRDGGLRTLDGRHWDAVIDTCGYLPRQVDASARFLADSVDLYCFISTISVYLWGTSLAMDEEAPIHRLEDASVETVTGETYGGLKALCEEAAEAAMPGRTLVIRPGLIVGPDDQSGRFTYWPLRMARSGEILAPGQPDAPVQIIDVRDLAEWTVGMVKAGATGIYNATGPDYPLTISAVLEACRETVDPESGSTLTWVDEVFLTAHEVGPYVEMPLWLPESALDMQRAVCDKAFAAGLTFRPLAETIRDTLAWAQSRPADTPMNAGLTPEREAALLAAWHEQE
ncbi:MAG: NAD-dependent epimerase/dehydratase family protein [Caldilineaceae bacterium]|nr:NAD-dependent epimerase/dehydratase family protein [Caldilineaceae bacterium]